MGTQYSVIVTSHNRPHLLARALRSVGMQETDSIEVIVAMDAWCKDSVQVVNDFEHPHKKLLVLPGFKGPSETRNTAKDQARGEWIVFLDDDDQLIPGYLADLTPHVHDRSQVLWTNYIVQQEHIDGNQFESLGWEEKLIEDRNPEELEISNFIPNSSLVYPRELIRDIDFDIHLSSLEDWDYLINIKRKYAMKPISLFSSVISMPTNKLTRNSGSQQSDDHFMDILHIYRKWRSNNPLIKELRLKKMNNRFININQDHF